MFVFFRGKYYASARLRINAFTSSSVEQSAAISSIV
jgi:hypothetical protein